MCFMTWDQAFVAREILLWAFSGAGVLAVMIVVAAWVVERQAAEAKSGAGLKPPEQQQED